MHFHKGRIHKSDNTSHRIAARPSVIAKEDHMSSLNQQSTPRLNINGHETRVERRRRRGSNLRNCDVSECTNGRGLFHAWIPLAWKDKIGLHALNRGLFFDVKPRNGRAAIVRPMEGGRCHTNTLRAGGDTLVLFIATAGPSVHQYSFSTTGESNVRPRQVLASFDVLIDGDPGT
jgi:hypothetical protein